MTTLELASKYYPKLWGKERIENLVTAGKLAKAEAEMVYEGVTMVEQKEGCD